jgi:hypothetical protein
MQLDKSEKHFILIHVKDIGSILDSLDNSGIYYSQSEIVTFSQKQIKGSELFIR